jgi:hypothetical protein
MVQNSFQCDGGNEMTAEGETKRFVNYVCRCGQEVDSQSPPAPIRWSDGHVCKFVLVEKKSEPTERK